MAEPQKDGSPAAELLPAHTASERRRLSLARRLIWVLAAGWALLVNGPGSRILPFDLQRLGLVLLAVGLVGPRLLSLSVPRRDDEKPVGQVRLMIALSAAAAAIMVLGMQRGFLALVQAVVDFLWGGYTMGRPLRGARRRRERTSSGLTAADLWRRFAREEHESIGSFTELALDLAAAGAPPALIERCRRAASDELRHAELCRQQATRLGGTVEPWPMPGSSESRRRPSMRIHLLLRIAAESLLDGEVGELSSALALRATAREAEPEVAVVLRALARDEGSHAALARDITAWACQQSRLVAAVIRRLRSLLQHLSVPPRQLGERWIREGIPSDSICAHAYRRAVRHAAFRIRPGQSAIAAARRSP